MSDPQLIKAILEQFPTLPPVDFDEILYSGASAYGIDSELEEIRTFFAERPWNQVQPVDVFRFRHALPFFSKKAFAYFTPAWMACALRDESRMDTAIDNLVGHLEEADPKLWTRPQRQVICEWLDRFDNVDLDIVRFSFERAQRNLHVT